MNYGEFIEKIENENDKIVNIYKSGDDYYIVYGEKNNEIRRIEYKNVFVGFEMEIKGSDELLEFVRYYHSGMRRRYRGGKMIFATVELDGSLSGEGVEFISAMHKAGDRNFFKWFNLFFKQLRMYNIYTDDDCGGHMHISGWDYSDADAVFGALRAYEPMLIGLFGNGEYGIMRENDYSSITPIIRIKRYGRSNIHVINSLHYELRFFDGEIYPKRWYEREMVVDAIVHIGRSVMKEGIGRYVNVWDWWKMYDSITRRNEINIDAFKNMKNDFVRLAYRSKYPNAELVEKIVNREEYEYVGMPRISVR